MSACGFDHNARRQCMCSANDMNQALHFPFRTARFCICQALLLMCTALQRTAVHWSPALTPSLGSMAGRRAGVRLPSPQSVSQAQRAQQGSWSSLRLVHHLCFKRLNPPRWLFSSTMNTQARYMPHLQPCSTQQLTGHLLEHPPSTQRLEEQSVRGYHHHRERHRHGEHGRDPGLGRDCSEP